ncbi:MAG: PKD domain-containing protein [Bacteroidetes bacterium]|nr:PKD domain-containing protein [Bacteroidota bacterium]
MNSKYIYLLVIALYATINTSCHKKHNNTTPSTNSTPSFDFNWSAFPVSISIIDFNSTITDTVNNTFRWDFGDGKMSTEARPQHYFGSTGSYQVSLTINGDFDHKLTKTVEVKYPVRYKGTGTMVEGDTVYFTQDADPGNTFVWNFGDGTTSTEWSPKHIYKKAGTYNTSLRVNDKYDAYIASYYSNTMVIFKDPQIAAVTGNRSWDFIERYQDLQLGVDSTSSLQGEQITIKYIDKVTVYWPGSKFSMGDDLRYDNTQSKNNLLVFVSKSNERLVYDRVADTMHFTYIHGYVGGQGVPANIKISANGTTK